MKAPGGRRREQIAAIAERYQISSEDVVYAPAQGLVNDVYFLGDALVVRIPRGGGAPIAELEKEASVIPAARRVGVRTPAIVTYDVSGTIIDAPYLVTERIHARDLGVLGVDPHRAADAYRDLGRSLVRLHTLHRSLVGRLSGVEPDPGVSDDPRTAVDRLATSGLIDPEQGRWLTDWFVWLEKQRPVDIEPVLIHGDVAPQNLLVGHDASEMAGIVDWGDAAWADPAMDFAKLPLRALPYVLEGYLAEGTDAEGSWEARALWYHLYWALGRLESPGSPGRRHSPRVWTSTVYARILELLRFFAESPPHPWRRLAVY